MYSDALTQVSSCCFIPSWAVQAVVLPGIDGHAAGNRVSDAGAGTGVCWFYDYEGPLL